MTVQKSVFSGAVIAVVAVLVGVPGVEARRGADDANEHAAVSSVDVAITEAKAIEIAKARLDGTVKKAKLEREHGKKTWQVRIFSTDGLKRGDFRIDANSGSILREKIKNIGSKKVERAEKRAEKMEKKKLKLEEKMKKKAAKRAEKEARKSGSTRSDD